MFIHNSLIELSKDIKYYSNTEEILMSLCASTMVRRSFEFEFRNESAKDLRN